MDYFELDELMSRVYQAAVDGGKASIPVINTDYNTKIFLPGFL